MVEKENVLIFDIDGTLCEIKNDNQKYIDVKPKLNIVNKLKDYHKKGFYIILYTARSMKSYQGNVGKINANTAKVVYEWLERYDIPYDEVHFGKPWCGMNGFYIDDKAVRPSEFEKLSFSEIQELINLENK